MKILLFSFIITSILGCKDTNKPETLSKDSFSTQLKGTWKAKSLFLSDASTNVCHEIKSDRDITLTFSDELADDKSSYKISGSAPINNYFGNLTLISFDNETKIGKILISKIGATEMAGSIEMMTCEQNFFSFLGETTGIQFVEGIPNTLYLGRIRDNTMPTRDGGTYYVFEKIK